MSRYRGFAGVALLGLISNAGFAQDKPSPPPIGNLGGTQSPPESKPCRHCGSSFIPDFKGWTLAGSAPQEYSVGYQSTGEFLASKSNAVISSRAEAKGDGFCTVMQTISAEDYRGQRVRFSALLRPQAVDEGAGLWFRVDGADGKVLAFDNMRSRPILGTQAWKRYDVVLDVSENANRLAYGVLLIGKGKLGVDELHFESVGKNVPTTNDDDLPKAPVNLELKH